MRVLDNAVQYKSIPYSEIRWPAFSEMQESAGLLRTSTSFKHLLQDVFSVTDGGRFPCAESQDIDLQKCIL